MTLSWLPIADRLKKLPTYPFSRMEELRRTARSQGIDLIDLGMGDPGGPTPQPIVESAIAALQQAQNHGYPPFEGTLEFRTAITEWYERRYGVHLDPNSEVLPLIGSKEGLNNLAFAYINPGDLVIVPTPAYP
ncbi:MAG: aminotransferase class I/II-fold pyridoxal phosphate-dependent enzyme, partial [Pseudanabaenaceae cyanobacterium bins.68]|nr:aminotransferase class I/II-fold pyridoxal phosphate-dependent enzyme [Pseudanabaenaceae cyanobacterium bins.68]